LVEFEFYKLAKSYHGRVEENLVNGNNIRDDTWTKSMALSSRGFVGGVDSMLGILDKGRQSIKRRTEPVRSPGAFGHSKGSFWGQKR